jgi:threonyl-tRNA synthetase
VGEDGERHEPIIVHRGILSTMERMVALLIEEYEGNFPLWLAPVQAVVIPIADRHIDYAEQVAVRLRDQRLRVNVDARNERMNAKIRDAQMKKVPYMLVVGDREAEAQAAAVRVRGGGDMGARPVDEIISLLVEQRDSKALEPNVFPEASASD